MRCAPSQETLLVSKTRHVVAIVGDIIAAPAAAGAGAGTARYTVGANPSVGATVPSTIHESTSHEAALLVILSSLPSRTSSDGSLRSTPTIIHRAITRA